MTFDAASTLRDISPYVGLFSFLVFTLIIPIVLWAKGIKGELTLQRTNCLTTLQANTSKTNDKLDAQSVLIASGDAKTQELIRTGNEKTHELLTEIVTVLRERK